jgi:PAS domain S-box-containing protein
MSYDLADLLPFDADYLPYVLGAGALLYSLLTRRSQANPEPTPLRKGERFRAKKKISDRDQFILDVLASDKRYCWVITDPDRSDNPIIFASPGFCRYTGYKKREIEGRNCRFLQGPATRPEDVERIRRAVREKREECVYVLNYKKNGKPFHNQFFIMPIFEHASHNLDRSKDEVRYYLGVQSVVPTDEDGQAPANPGWVAAMCS